MPTLLVQTSEALSILIIFSHEHSVTVSFYERAVLRCVLKQDIGRSIGINEFPFSACCEYLAYWRVRVEYYPRNAILVDHIVILKMGARYPHVLFQQEHAIHVRAAVLKHFVFRIASIDYVSPPTVVVEHIARNLIAQSE